MASFVALLATICPKAFRPSISTATPLSRTTSGSALGRIAPALIELT